MYAKVGTVSGETPGQEGRDDLTVNHPRKLQRFESSTRHPSDEAPLTCTDRPEGLFRAVRLCPELPGFPRPATYNARTRLAQCPLDPLAREVLPTVKALRVHLQQ